MKQYKLLFALFVILVVDTMSFGIVLPVLPKLFLGNQAMLVSQTTSLSMRYTLMGLVLGVYPLAVCIGTPILGILSDRFGRKPVLFFSLSGTFVALCFSAVALALSSVMLLLMARVLTGLCSASQPIAQAAVADMSHAHNRAFYFSLVAFAMTVGMLAGPLLGGFLPGAMPFYVAGILALGNLIFMSFLYKETFPVAKYRLTGLKQYAQVCLQHLTQKKVISLLLIFVMLEFCWSLFFQTQPVILAKLFAYNSQQQSLYITFLGGVMCFGLVALFKPLTKIMSLSKLTFYCLAANTLGYGFMCIFSGEIATWLLTMSFTLGVGLCYTALISQLSLLIPQQQQGWLMGFTSALLAFSWAIAGLIGPKLLQISDLLPLLICFVFSAVTLPFVGRVKSTTQIPARV